MEPALLRCVGVFLLIEAQPSCSAFDYAKTAQWLAFIWFFRIGLDREGKQVISVSDSLSVLRGVTSLSPAILMYHGVPHICGSCGGIDAAGFERQIQYLKNKYEIISPKHIDVTRNRFARHRVLITFDDGFRNNYEVAVPILHQHGVPAVFFISSRHCEPGKYLWFTYLRALFSHFKGNGFTYHGEFMSMSPEFRSRTIRRLYDHLLSLKPHPSAMYQEIEAELPPICDFVQQMEIESQYAGMTAQQVFELSDDPLFSCGAHTVDHPCLSLCEPEVAEQQIRVNKSWLERVTGKPCEWIAYPKGDYDRRSIDFCRQAGFSSAFAVNPQLNIDHTMEIPRIGIYSSSLSKLGVKVIGARVLSNKYWSLFHSAITYSKDSLDI